jgi:hypothetical protein
MRKFTHLDSLDKPRRRASKAPLVVLFALILVASPPLFEVAKLNLARHGLLGLSTPVETPLLDVLSAQWQYSHSELRDWVTPLLVNRMRWSPNLVLPVAFFWAGVAAFMLRRGH